MIMTMRLVRAVTVVSAFTLTALGCLSAPVANAETVIPGFQLPRPVVPGIRRKSTSLLLDHRSPGFAGFSGVDYRSSSSGYGGGGGGARTRAQQASSWYDYRQSSNGGGGGTTATVLEREPRVPPRTPSPHAYFEQRFDDRKQRMRRPDDGPTSLWKRGRNHRRNINNGGGGGGGGGRNNPGRYEDRDGPRSTYDYNNYDEREERSREEEYRRQRQQEEDRQDEMDYVRGIRQSLEELRREHKEMLHEERQLHKQNEMNQLERIRHQAKLLERREAQQLEEDERQRRHYEAIMEERRREQGYHRAEMTMEQRRNEEIRRKYQEHVMRQREQRRPGNNRPSASARVEMDTDQKRARELQEARHRYYEEEARRRVEAQQEERERRKVEERQYEELMAKRREAQRYAAQQRQEQERRRQLEEERRQFQQQQQQEMELMEQQRALEEEEEHQERQRRQEEQEQRRQQHRAQPEQAMQNPEFQQRQQRQQPSAVGFGEMDADDELNKAPRANPAGVSYVRYKKNQDDLQEEDVAAPKQPQKVYERYSATKAAQKASVQDSKEQPFQLNRYPQQIQGRFERYRKESGSSTGDQSAYVRYEKPSLDSPQEMPQQQQQQQQQDLQSSPSDGIRMERYVTAAPRYVDDKSNSNSNQGGRFERYVPEPKEREPSIFDKYMRYERPPPEVLAAQQEKKIRLEQPQQQQFHQPPLEQLERYVKPQDSNQPVGYQDIYRGLRKQETLNHQKRESFQHGLSGTYFTPGRYGGT